MCPSSNQCIGLAHKNKNQGTSLILHHPILGLSKFALHVDLKNGSTYETTNWNPQFIHPKIGMGSNLDPSTKIICNFHPTKTLTLVL
jgi:hypothetical protein